MKKILKVLLVVITIAFVAIQFIRPAENSGVEAAESNITAKYAVPENVQQVLNVSCYDCHSNTTHYPWYSNIQPVAWVLTDHIVEGKKELNFSAFTNYPAWRQYKKFREIGKEIKEGDMPMASYTLLHRNAALTSEQKSAILDWAANAIKDMETKYPSDSLAQPKKG